MPTHDSGDLQARFVALETKLEAIYISVEKTRRYFQWVLIATVVAFVLPLLGLVFAVPSFLSSYAQIDQPDQTGQMDLLNSLLK